MAADLGAPEVVVVNARIEGTANVSASPLVIAVYHDGALDVQIDAPTEWSPCAGYLPITYTVGSIGHSPAPAATIRLWPNIVRPTGANGLQTPPGETAITPALAYPSAGTAVVPTDGSVLWAVPPLGPGATATLRVFVAVGRVVGDRDGARRRRLDRRGRWRPTRSARRPS